MLKTLLVLCLTVVAATAATVRVPSEQPTIQAGLYAALAGDTVLVAPGTYLERVVWPAVDGITLLSEGGADSTVISAADSGRVVTMNAIDYTTATRLSGFTLTRGSVATYPGNGAGLWCRGAPEIARNRIVDNQLTTMGFGGGVYAQGAPLFHDNLAAWDTIANEGGGGWRYGAGVYCTGSGVFYQNAFVENAGLGGAGGFWRGGGLYLGGGTPVVFANLFLGNRMGTTTGGIAYGGGLYVDSADAYVVNNTFSANVCSTAISYGGGIYVQRNWSAVVKNNILAGNVCDGLGKNAGAIAAQPDTLGDTLTVDYNDAWANSPNDYYGVRVGPHSLGLDPLFVTGSLGEYYLSYVGAGQPETSPCVDAGDTVMTSPVNVDSMLRAWTTRTDSVPDAGALDLGYHYRATELTGISGPKRVASRRHYSGPSIVRGTLLLPSSLLTIHHSLFDLDGRRVAELQPGANDVSRLSPGVYFVTSGRSAVIGERSAPDKVILTR